MLLPRSSATSEYHSFGREVTHLPGQSKTREPMVVFVTNTPDEHYVSKENLVVIRTNIRHHILPAL